MAKYEHLPIYRTAMQLAVHLENVVKGFSRYHKYTLGAELRNGAHDIVCLIIEANSASDRMSFLEKLRSAIERVKVTARICQEVKAFKNFNSFTTTVEYLVSLGRQNEGWLKNTRGKKVLPELSPQVTTGVL